MIDAQVELSIDESENARIGRLFQLKLKKNLASRTTAKETIRKLPNQRWQARVGGLVRGEYITRSSKVDVETAIDDHYSLALHDWVLATEKRRSRVGN